MNENYRGRGPQRIQPPPQAEEEPKEEKRMRFSVEMPYPQLTGIVRNTQNARLLSALFAGAHGELTACTQYVQHGMVLNHLGQTGAEVLQGVAVSEMHHLKLLGEMILRCGGRAAYCDWQRRTVWNGRMVQYARDARRIWQADILGERAAIAAYRWTRDRVNDLCIVEVIDRILLDEELHLRLFQEQAALVRPGTPTVSPSD